MTAVFIRAVSAALVAVLATYGCAQSTPAAAGEPFGTWLTEDGRARVRTERCRSDPSRLCGFVVWGSQPLDETGKPKTDNFNPDPKKRSRLLLGHQMFMGLKLDEDGRYAGKIYNGDNGKLYDVTVWSEQPTDLTVKGCMLAVLCGSQTWARAPVSDLGPGQLQGATDTPGGPRSDPEWASHPGKATNAGALPKRPAGTSSAASD